MEEAIPESGAGFSVFCNSSLGTPARKSGSVPSPGKRNRGTLSLGVQGLTPGRDLPRTQTGLGPCGKQVLYV